MALPPKRLFNAKEEAQRALQTLLEFPGGALAAGND